jgi:CRISPR-associated protein Cas2
MYWILCYDVVHDRRRTRFHKHLKRHLLPVQKSVFEGVLDATARDQVERLIYEELDMATDSVRMYPLSDHSRRGIRTFGTAAPPPDPEAPLVL